MNETIGAPRLSIVIAAWTGVATLRECLASLHMEAGAPEVEVLVASNFNGDVRPILACEFPFARFLEFPRGTSVPQLRAAGVRESRGEIIAVAEDFCTFDQAWCAEILKAHAGLSAAVGGAIENATGSGALDWAVYFFDYGRYMLPAEPGPAAQLSGLNVAYKRAALEQVWSGSEKEFHESEVHDQLLRHGQTLSFAPGAVVYHRKHYEFARTTWLFFHQARSYAAQRIRARGPLQRIGYAAGALLLPLLLPLRVAGVVLHRRRHGVQYLGALPALFALMFCWAAGEFCGYLFGVGTSASRWR